MLVEPWIIKDAVDRSQVYQRLRYLVGREVVPQDQIECIAAE